MLVPARTPEYLPGAGSMRVWPCGETAFQYEDAAHNVINLDPRLHRKRSCSSDSTDRFRLQPASPRCSRYRPGHRCRLADMWPQTRPRSAPRSRGPTLRDCSAQAPVSRRWSGRLYSHHHRCHGLRSEYSLFPSLALLESSCHRRSSRMKTRICCVRHGHAKSVPQLTLSTPVLTLTLCILSRSARRAVAD